MLKSLLVIFTIIYTNFVFAVTFNFYDGCNESPRAVGTTTIDIAGVSVGEMTISVLDSLNIPYMGTKQGLNSFYDSPIGLNALEAISDTKLRAYGPCYMLDGVIMDRLPGEVQFNSQNSEVTWFLGYANYDSGVWTNYCVPSHFLKSDFICSSKVSKNSSL